MSNRIQSERAPDDELEAASLLAEADEADVSIYNVDEEAIVIIVRDETWAAFLLAQIQAFAGSAQLANALDSWQDIEA